MGSFPLPAKSLENLELGTNLEAGSWKLEAGSCQLSV
jgi:hypothetical protein